MLKVGDLESCTYCWQARSQQAPVYATSAVRDISVRLAEVAARGLIQLGTLPGGAPVSWQLIRGGAVADPDVRHCLRFAPVMSFRPWLLL